MSVAPETGLAGPGILPTSPRATRGESTARALRDSEAKYRIDLLVTDVAMPGLQGHQLAEQLSDIRPGLRVLYVSGFTESSVVDHGVVGEGIAFLPKPYTVEALGRAVRLVLDKQA